MMVPNLLFYQLLLVALALICLIIHVCLPAAPPLMSKTPLKPDKPRHKRSKEPKPFTGYLHKPLCQACDNGTEVLSQFCSGGRARAVAPGCGRD
jgi:hypothetical protein